METTGSSGIPIIIFGSFGSSLANDGLGMRLTACIGMETIRLSETNFIIQNTQNL